MVNEMRAKPDGSLLPRFVYFYVINPHRLEYAASQLLVDIKACFLIIRRLLQSSPHAAFSIKSTAVFVFRLQHGERGGSQGKIGGPQAPV
jgi:hypothetical protein